MPPSFLLSRLGQIDVFIHDSLHSERNVELDRVWEALLPGGAIVVAMWTLIGHSSRHPDVFRSSTTISEAEPLRPDLRRFNQKGLFGISVKQQSTTVLALDRMANCFDVRRSSFRPGAALLH